MMVDLHNLLDGCRLHQRAGDSLLHGKDDSLTGLDPDSCAAQLDGLDGVLHLEQSSLRREGVWPTVVLGSVEKHLDGWTRSV